MAVCLLYIKLCALMRHEVLMKLAMNFISPTCVICLNRDMRVERMREKKHSMSVDTHHKGVTSHWSHQDLARLDVACCT